MPPSSEPLAAPPPAWAGWLHALWGDRAALASLEPAEGGRPVLVGRAPGERVLYLPPRPDRGRAWAAAAAAHAAAHWRFGGDAWPRTGLKPVQQALAEVMEDARVEWLALQEQPGLRALWLPFHAGDDAPAGDGFDALLGRLARSLLEPLSTDPHPWVTRARGEFFAPDGRGLAVATPQALRALASRLGNDIGQMRLPFNARTWRVHAAYRDDGSWLWQPQAQAPDSETSLPVQASAQACTPSEDAPPAQAGPPVLYPEWDQRIGRYRHDWCQVFTCEAPVDSGRRPPAASHGQRRRLAQALAALPGGAPRLAGRAGWGDEFHLMALVDARVQRLARQAPDPNVYHRRVAPPQPLAVQLLLDASASTGERCADGRPLLEHMLAAALACAGALEAAGHRSALVTFASRTRHRVEVRHLKHWHERAAAGEVLARCAGQRSGGSTRLGAALRHAAAQALAQARAEPAHRPLVLLLTDGEAHDVDAPDPAYLRGDLRRAIAEAQAVGIAVHSLPATLLAA